MSSSNQDIDIRLLVHWLGVQGAKAGLKGSRSITVEILNRLAKELRIELSKRATRQELIDEIVRVASKRIDKSVDDLYQMQQDEIIHYFDDIGVESGELLDLLKQLDLKPSREGRRDLIRFVARELSETGRFMRIASKGKPPHSEPISARDNHSNH